MNMQEFISSTIEPSTGEYQYDSDNSMDMKLKEISEMNNVPIRKYLEEREKRITEENNKKQIDELSTTSSEDPKYRCISIVNNNMPITSNTIPAHVTSPVSTPSYVVHYPDWYFEIMRTNVHDKAFKKVLLEKYWMIESLREEIVALSPRRSDISLDNLTQDFSVNPEQFKSCCRMMFPLHRTFVNYKQLHTAADLLFKQWKILMKANQKSTRCNYSHTPARSRVKKQQELYLPPSKKRKNVKTSIPASNVPFVSTGHM